jgi:arsenate reductase
MAEAILRAVAPDRFNAYSAGCFPNGVVNHDALDFLHRHHIPVASLRAKSVHAFRSSDAARVDFIITLCDAAADEDFSSWPGAPFVAHWNVQDDSASEADEALRNDFWTLMRRIKIFTSLPPGKLSRRLLEERAVRLEPGYR